MTWRDRAACAGRTDIDFFSDDVFQVARCRELCSRCPVVSDCLVDAAGTGDGGIRGGLEATERWRIVQHVQRSTSCECDVHRRYGHLLGPVHGRSRYNKGCRCDVCRGESVTYNRERKRWLRLHKEPTVVHEQVTEIPALSTFVTQGE